MYKLLPALLLAFGVALAITPAVRRAAFKIGAIDRPNQRKVHQRIMPRMGGLAIFISFTLALLLTGHTDLPTIGLLTGGLVIVAVGIIDDIKELSPKVKLMGQIAAALVVIPFGVKVDFITNPFSGGIIALGILTIPVTVFWIISATNAVNLIDGLDGLAGGTSLIAAVTMAAIAWNQAGAPGGLASQYDMAVMALVLAAATLGFLRHNFYPAKIFLGDTGSMFLGYTLSTLAIMGLTKTATAISVIIPFVILGIPLLDTTFAILRRYNKHMPIFQPDKDHLHHRLMALGLSHKNTVLVIYLVNILLGVSAYLLTVVTTAQAVMMLVFLATVIIISANKIGVIGRKTRTGVKVTQNYQQRSSKM